MGRIKIALAGCLVFFSVGAHFCSTADAAGIRIIPSTPRVVPGGDFYFDVVAEGIPAEGLGGVQFRINLSAPGSNVTGVNDLGKGGGTDIAVASPLLISSPTSDHSGIGDFFWNGRGNSGVLVMDNELLANGSALYTFAHTNGAIPPSGSGSVARFMVRVGNAVSAEHIFINLSDVMLLDGGPAYPLDYNIGASVLLRCMTKAPSLLGLSLGQAQAALASANLLSGNVYELDNHTDNHPLNVVLEQSATAGSDLNCQTPVNLAINTPPADVTRVVATDKPADDTGAVILSWAPSVSADAAGYRLYLGSTLLKVISNPTATTTETGVLATGIASLLKITAYDTFGNESPGVTVTAVPVDDVPPSVTITGLAEGVYYRNDVVPQVSVFDNNLASQSITLNGTPFSLAPITVDGNYTMSVTGADRFGNKTTKSVNFTIDKTPPAIVVANVTNGGFYNTDVAPGVTVTDANLKGSSLTLNGQPYVSGTPLTAEGSYALTVSAEDLAGNTATRGVSFIIDKTSPISTADLSLPKYATNGVTYISGQTPLTISAQDNGIAPSGVAGVDYSLDDVHAWSSYFAPVTLAGAVDGGHTLSFKAYDKATNSENYHTLTVTIDNTPPSTTLTTAGGSHVLAGGVLAATSLTVFSLQATDLLSGVSKTEYRIDGSQWRSSELFALPSEGAHTIEYRSADNLGNTEIVKSQVVLVDNTPPVSLLTIGSEQYGSNDTLYVSGRTGLTINASDSASGVKMTEYSIDGAPFTTYGAPFNLAACPEGSHTITYRSVDNLGNVETTKQLTVVLDKTSPKTAITGSTPLTGGVVNTISVATNFTLSATDNLSGVKSIWYRVNNGEWQLYTTGFTLAGFKVGRHDISFNAVDNLGNEEPVQTITVRLVDFEIKKRISLDPIVLVGPQNSDKLLVMLESLGISYYPARDEDDFKLALRSGRFNTYLLIDDWKDEVGGEMREGIYFGEGIIIIKNRPANDGYKMSGISGVRFNGKSTENDLLLNLPDGPLGPAANIQTTGKTLVAQVTSSSAMVHGTLADKKGQYPAIVSNEYGRGNAITFTFDLPNLPDKDKATKLLESAINLVKPKEHYLRAQDSVPVRIDIANSTEPFELELDETVPLTTTADTITPAGVVAANGITWRQYLRGSEVAKFGYYLNLPDTKGEYTTTTETKFANIGVYKTFNTYDLTLKIAANSAELLQTVISGLHAIPATNINDKRQIAESIAELHQIRQTVVEPKETAENIEKITEAVEKLAMLTIDVKEIRLELDALLKIWQRKWYLLN